MDALPVIRDKHDIESAQRLVSLGYPKVGPALGTMLEWIQDMNWPVAGVLAPFLATLGEPISPAVWRILRSDDHVWKYWTISAVIAEMPMHAARQFETELRRLVETPTADERREELDEVASSALARWDERRSG